MFKLGTHEFIVGIGSNCADAAKMLRLARNELRSFPQFKIVATSPIYESDALLPPGAPAQWNIPYLNAAVRMEWLGSASSFKKTPEAAAEETVAQLKEIEKSLGRAPAPRWAPRLIDLDLLAWGGPPVTTPLVTVPHAGLWERPFALLPAQDCSRVFGAESDENLAIKDKSRAWRFSFPEDVPFRTRVSSQVWPEIVGIMNVTPDSFSEVNHAPRQEDIASRIRQMVQDGATIIDVGAESTRPGAPQISWRQECERLEPSLDVLLELKRELGFKISLDTRNSDTLLWFLKNTPPGFLDWINDVEGFSHPEMIAIAKNTSGKIVFMHSLGVPPSRDQILDPTIDVLSQIVEWAERRRDRLTEQGIAASRLIFDPGIGFGKTPAQNIDLLLRANELACLKIPVLIGHSRKRFLDPSDTIPASQRDLETAVLTAQMATGMVDYFRVHSPAIQMRALKMAAKLHP